MPGFEEEVERAREREALRQAEAEQARADRLAREQQANEQRLQTTDLSGEVRHLASGIVRLLREEDIAGNVGFVDASTDRISTIIRTANQKGRSNSLGGSNHTTQAQIKRHQEKKQAYLERKIGPRMVLGWKMNNFVQYTEDVEPHGTSTYEDILGANGRIYDRGQQLYMHPAFENLPVITVWGETNMQDRDRLANARTGLANVAARYNLDITRIA